MSALTTLVQKYLKSNNLSRKDLAKSVGYSNINKGLRTIDHYLEFLQDKNNVASKIQQILNIPESEYTKAINQVQSNFDDKARKKFRPFLQVILSDRPSPLFIAGMCPNLWHCDIPDISQCSFEQEIKIIFQVYKRHQLKVNSNLADGAEYDQFLRKIEQMDKDNEKYSWTVGKGFLYFRLYGQTIAFNRQGEITEHIEKYIEPNSASVSVGGKIIPPSVIGCG